MFNPPSWYVTPQEFADLVVETMEELKYFKSDEFAHPEDINNTFVIVAEAIAKGMSHTGKRVFDAQKKQEGLDRIKQAVMKPSFTKGPVLPDDDEIGGFIDPRLINKNPL